MKKILLTLAIVLLSFLSKAQEIVVKDSSSKEPVKFAIIKYGKNGFYTDENGRFNLKKINSDTFIVSSTGFKSKEIEKNKAKKTIYLQPKITHLKEITIKANKKEHIKIKPNRKLFWFNNISNWLLDKKGEEIITILTPKQPVQNTIITKLTINFEKINERKDLKGKPVKVLIRLKIYDVKNLKLNNLIYNSEPISINSFDKDQVDINIAENNIYFKKESIAIVIEMIDYNNKKNLPKRVKTPILRPSLTKKDENEYFSAKTYIKNNLEKSNELIPIRDEMKKFTGEDLNRNLRIGLELIK